MISLALVSLPQVIMDQRIIGIETQDALIFVDDFIQLSKLQISISQTILERINVPVDGRMAQRLPKARDRLSSAPALKSDEPVIIGGISHRKFCPSNCVGKFSDQVLFQLLS